jgi:hypothetical protein
MRLVTETIDRVVEAGLYNFWISMRKHWLKLLSRKIAIVHQLNGYYSFNVCHMQSAIFLLLLAWCLRAICFMFEVLCNGVLSKRK